MHSSYIIGFAFSDGIDLIFRTVDAPVSRAETTKEDRLLLFRFDDFFELFLDDATVASRTLGITIISRNK